MLVEGTGPQRLLDLIFGLTEGWWKFADRDLRPDYPLISRARWHDVLCAEGFLAPGFLPAGDEGDMTHQAVIISSVIARDHDDDNDDEPPGRAGRRTTQAATAHRPGANGSSAKGPARNDAPRRLHLPAAATEAERRQAVEEYLRAELAQLLGLSPSEVAPDRPVTSFGLDSLMAIQLKNRLDTNVGATVSIVTVLEGLSLAEIAERIVDQLETGRRGGDGHHGGRDGTGHQRHDAPGSNGHSIAPRPVKSAPEDELLGLSEADLDAMIEDLISLEDASD